MHVPRAPVTIPVEVSISAEKPSNMMEIIAYAFARRPDQATVRQILKDDHLQGDHRRNRDRYYKECPENKAIIVRILSWLYGVGRLDVICRMDSEHGSYTCAVRSQRYCDPAPLTIEVIDGVSTSVTYIVR